MDYEKMKNTVDSIIERHKERTPVVAILQDIQEEYRYLPKDALIYLSEQIDVSIAKIYSVATFYENFSLEPKGKYVIRICDGTACHVRKSIPILNAIRNELDLTDGKSTTDDGLVTVETVSCLGACGLAPVLTINDKVHPAMTPETAIALIAELKQEECHENQ